MKSIKYFFLSIFVSLLSFPASAQSEPDVTVLTPELFGYKHPITGDISHSFLENFMCIPWTDSYGEEFTYVGGESEYPLYQPGAVPVFRMYIRNDYAPQVKDNRVPKLYNSTAERKIKRIKLECPTKTRANFYIFRSDSPITLDDYMIEPGNSSNDRISVEKNSSLYGEWIDLGRENGEGVSYFLLTAMDSSDISGDENYLTSVSIEYAPSVQVGVPELGGDREGLSADGDGWYTLTGLRLDNVPEVPGLYVRVQDGRSSKVRIK